MQIPNNSDSPQVCYQQSYYSIQALKQCQHAYLKRDLEKGRLLEKLAL